MVGRNARREQRMLVREPRVLFLQGADVREERNHLSLFGTTSDVFGSEAASPQFKERCIRCIPGNAAAARARAATIPIIIEYLIDVIKIERGIFDGTELIIARLIQPLEYLMSSIRCRPSRGHFHFAACPLML